VPVAEHGKWGGVVEGHAFDLADWADALIAPYDPWIEQWSIGGTACQVLRSRDFEDARDSQEAHERATLLVAKLNGAFAARCHSDPVTLRGIADKLPDGTVRQMIVMAVGTARGRSRLSAIADRNASTPPPPSTIQTWLQSATGNAFAEDLLMHLSKPDNWYDLYKAFEDVRKLCGNETLLKKRSWCPAGKELDTFKHTANYHRHSLADPARRNPPSEPMHLTQASRMIRAMVVGVLTDLSAGNGE
jgi:hypothetical protein